MRISDWSSDVCSSDLASTVVATHVNQILQSQSCQLLGQAEVQKLLDTLQAAAPQLVGNITKALSLQTLTQVLQTLLDESVPVRDFRRIDRKSTRLNSSH